MRATTFWLLMLAAVPARAQAEYTLEQDVALRWEQTFESLLAADDESRGVIAAGGRVHVIQKDRRDPYDVLRIHARDGETGALLWSTTYDPGPLSPTLEPDVLAVSPDGGRLFLAIDQAESADFADHVGQRMVVVAFDTVTGDELWQRVFQSPFPLTVYPSSAGLSNDGAVLYVGGRVSSYGNVFGGEDARDGFVLALSVADGATVWSVGYDGPEDSFDAVVDLAVDPVSDRVFTLLSTSPTLSTSGMQFLTRALDTQDGSLIWEQFHGPGVTTAQIPRDVVTDGTTVIVGGETVGVDPIVAYDASTGAFLWSEPFGGQDVHVLDLAADGSLLTALGPEEGTDDLRLEGIALTPSSTSWLSLLDTDTAVEAAGLSLERVEASGVLLVAGLVVSQTVGFVVDAATGAHLWSELTALPESTAVDAGATVVDTLSGARAVFTGRTQTEEGLLAETQAYELGDGFPSWSTTETGEDEAANDNTSGIAVSADGSRAWVRSLENLPTGGEDGTVSILHEVDVDDGSVLWSREETFLGSGMGILLWPQEGRLCMESGSGGSYGARCFDQDTGELEWSAVWTGPDLVLSGNDSLADGEFSADGSSLYAAGNSTVFLPQFFDTFYMFAAVAWDTSDSSVRWGVFTQASESSNARFRDLAVAPDDSRVYLSGRTPGASVIDVTTVALDAATGDELWTHTFDSGASEDVSRVLASPDGTRVLVAGRIHEPVSGVTTVGTFALDAATGGLLWSEVAEGALVEDTLSGLSLDAQLSADGSVLYHLGFITLTPGPEYLLRVTAVDTQTGQRIWTAAETSLENPVGRELHVTPDGRALLVVLNADGTLQEPTTEIVRVYALDASTGARLWSADRAQGDSPTPELAVSDRFSLLAGAASDVPLALDGLVLRYDPQPLQTGPSTLSLAAGGTQTFQLTAPAELGGHRYLVVGSATGTVPGIPLGGQVLPLVPDAYFLLSLATPNQPPFVNTLGLLDENGKATAALTLPAGLDPTLAGAFLIHALVVLGPGSTVELVSNPSPLLLLP